MEGRLGGDGRSIAPLNDQVREIYPAKIERRSISGVEHLLITPDSYDPLNAERILVYLDGGAHTATSPDSTFYISLPAAHFTQTKVLAVRYLRAFKSPLRCST